MKKQINASRAAVVLAFCGAMVACADSPTSPTIDPSFAVTTSTTIGTCPAGYKLAWTAGKFGSAGNNPGYAVDKNRNGYVCQMLNPTANSPIANYLDDN